MSKEIWEAMDRRRMARLMRPGWCYDCKGTGSRNPSLAAAAARVDAINGDACKFHDPCPHCKGTGTVTELTEFKQP